jgi:3-oxoacid CoA-transferase subunit A
MAVGSFGLCGIPEARVIGKEDSGSNLSVISNNAGVDGFGLGRASGTRQIRKMITSYVGETGVRAAVSGGAGTGVHAPQGTPG